MAELFVSKVRPIGSSLCVIIPNEIVKKEHLKAGRELRLSIINPNFKELERLMGSVKNAKPFQRDRRDRV